MKDSISRTRNRKAKRERGVHAIDSTRDIPNCLVEERCSESGNRKFMRKVSTERRYTTALVHWYRYAQNPDFYIALRSQSYQNGS